MRGTFLWLNGVINENFGDLGGNGGKFWKFEG